MLLAAVKSAMIVLLFCMADGVDVERGVLRGRFMSIVLFYLCIMVFCFGSGTHALPFFHVFLSTDPFTFFFHPGVPMFNFATEWRHSGVRLL